MVGLDVNDIYLFKLLIFLDDNINKFQSQFQQQLQQNKAKFQQQR